MVGGRDRHNRPAVCSRCLIASYLCFLAVYSIAVYVISTIRYQGAQKKLKWYGKELDDLQNMYEEQEKSGKKSGRRRKET